ncbi:DUF4389 domain-containing protein [Mariluticola halotolerans]|uniref:DUF4389 domain-containing protein n=1 Tax=Mariluticola halotolerans TaxID=2909283 RepID=UPI0026E1B618|nr:DUF4389 domain-containing protein [Mariluticola halotolerans]UJQ95521.1 DUF4389 domain-containing protein [Mariluticola halotolerans]
MTDTVPYAARLDIEYPERLDRLTTFFRLIWAIPILVILGLLTSSGSDEGSGILAGLFLATLLMIVFRQKYPRWWFDFALQFNRFNMRVAAYLFLLTDKYPSTDEPQNVHLDLDYPDAENGLNRWLPLIKWFLAIPHYLVLVVLLTGVIAATLIAWFVILFTGRYPRGLFDFVVGTLRWGTRVWAYAWLLITDDYPPFSFK